MSRRSACRANNLRSWGKDLSRRFRAICSVCPRPAYRQTPDGVRFCSAHFNRWLEQNESDQHADSETVPAECGDVDEVSPSAWRADMEA